MKIKISLKDSNTKLILDCKLSWQDGNAFCFLLKDGKTVKKYPMINVWFIEFDETENENYLGN